MLNDRSGEVQVSAINALGKIKNENAIDPLIALTTSTSVPVRASAIRALRRFDADNPKIAVVMKAALDDTDRAVRVAAAASFSDDEDGGDYYYRGYMGYGGGYYGAAASGSLWDE